MSERIFLVAAFSEVWSHGNPAGVCVSTDVRSSVWMQNVAQHLKQPATAFVIREKGRWNIRWFSPKTEIELCGHATLAAAKVLWALGFCRPQDRLHFRSSLTTLIAELMNDGQVRLDFPALAGSRESARPDVVEAVGQMPIGSARYDKRWIFEYDAAQLVRGLEPDFVALRRTGIRSLIVTARSDVSSFDIVSRNFAPLVGVDEDQVTGTAHIYLMDYWRDRLGPVLHCWQASPRGGSLTVEAEGDRVLLSGAASIISEVGL